MNEEYAFECQDCENKWTQEFSPDTDIDDISCEKCSSKSWHIIFQALNPSGEKVERFDVCPQCGAEQPPAPPGLKNLVYQRCIKCCGYERGRNKEQPTKEVHLKKERIKKNNGNIDCGLLDEKGEL